MTTKPQLSLLFCEDFRIEEGNKPFLTGILAPVIYMDDGELAESDTYTLVTYCLLPDGMTALHLNLSLIVSEGSKEVSVQTFSKEITQEQFADAGEVGEPWAIWIPLPIKLELGCGTRIDAKLKGGGAETWASLLVRSLDASPANIQAKTKKRRQRSKAHMTGQ